MKDRPGGNFTPRLPYTGYFIFYVDLSCLNKLLIVIQLEISNRCYASLFMSQVTNKNRPTCNKMSSYGFRLISRIMIRR